MNYLYASFNLLLTFRIYCHNVVSLHISGLKSLLFDVKNVHIRRFPSVGRELWLLVDHNCVVKTRALCTRRTRYRATHAIIRDFISRNVIIREERIVLARDFFVRNVGKNTRIGKIPYFSDKIHISDKN